MKLDLTMVQDVLFAAGKGMMEKVFGGWDGLLSALVLFMAVEYLTQILIAMVKKKASGGIGFRGIAKKITVFFLVAVGNAVDVLIIQNGNMLRAAVILFYLSNEGAAILNNAAKLGLPIPEKLRAMLEQIKDGK